MQKAFPLPVISSHCQKKFSLLRLLSATITLYLKVEDPILKEYQVVSKPEHSNTTPAKIPILDIGKFEQWKFRIQQYLQNEHYALWEVIKFGDSYEVPKESAATGSASDGKKGRTVAITTEDMQKRRNDVKATILKTFGGNEATRKTKKNLLKHQYGNFKAEGKETLEQTFNRLQEIVSQLEFMDRNRSDLDTMSLDDLYNHLKVYEPEVQKKSDSQNMAFISSSKNSSGNEEDNTASVPTASTQIKYEEITQIDEDDIEEMDIKWNMALLSMQTDMFLKKTGKKISIQGTDVVGFDKSKSYMESDEENHTLVADEEAPTEFALMAKPILIMSAVSPPAQVYPPPKKDMSWTGLPEFADDTITDYTRPSSSVESNPNDLQNSSSSAFENGESTGSILSKPEIKFDSGCSRHMTGNISYLSDYEPYDRGTHRQHNMYSIDLDNVVPRKDLTCLVAKASADECMLWHRRLGHLNIKTMNRLVRHNLVRGLPSKCFENDHTCVACLKGNQHKASCKTKLDETSDILRNFITEIENLKELRVKIIRCGNRGEFRNKEMNDFCLKKGIKREFSNARTPQQNGVAERRNRTLIEAARTMLADAKLPVTFWAEAVNTACYVQNRVLVNKSQNKTPYKLFNGRTSAIGFLKPFGYHVMILNTLDNLGKFEAKEDEGYFIRYKGSCRSRCKENVSSLRFIVLLNWFHEAHLETSTSNAQDACNTDAPKSSGNSNPTATSTNPSADHMKTLAVETLIPTVSSPVPTACLNDSPKPSSNTRLISKRVTSQDDMPSLDNILTVGISLYVTTLTELPFVIIVSYTRARLDN
nr:hypothetical protein [Tanacetum cinerariifolium]